MKWSLILLLAAIPCAAYAQDQQVGPPVEQFSAEEVVQIGYPDIQFEETEKVLKNYKKYFYFHRVDTEFNEAFHDIKECDAISNGTRYHGSYSEPYPGYYGNEYGVGGVIGATIGIAIRDAVFGSSERRKIKRLNMRKCMNFKGYKRYGLSKKLWRQFNFEEGNKQVPYEEKRAALLIKAKVASGPAPSQKAIEP